MKLDFVSSIIESGMEFIVYRSSTILYKYKLGTYSIIVYSKESLYAIQKVNLHTQYFKDDIDI